MRMRDTLAQLADRRLTDSGRLTPFPHFGSNSGALGAYGYVPADLPAGAPLVVALHGCTQSAAGYDAGTGWSRLADRAGFALLVPEQRRANNANLCFNWFQPGDIARKGGEAESIAQMVVAMVVQHGLDRGRVYITGLSAGGAMTAVMLATYPELFAGGAIIGGLPYGCARTVGEALEQMRSGASVSADIALVPRHPTVLIWHGSADTTVVVGNMDALAEQWCGVHGVGDAAPIVERGADWERRVWRVEGRSAVETWRIAGMGHGVPIGPAVPDRLGTPGPYMLAAGVDSTATIAASWGLVADTARVRPHVAAPVAPAAKAVSGIQTVIEDALRSAGLMR